MQESFARAMRIKAKSNSNSNANNNSSAKRLLEIEDFKVLEYTTQLIDGNDKLSNNKIQMLSINQASQASISKSKSKSQSQSRSQSKSKPKKPDHQFKMAKNLKNKNLRHYNARDNNNDNNNNNDKDANVDEGKADQVAPHANNIGPLNGVFSYHPDCNYSSDSDDSVNKTGATTDTGNESQL